MSKTTKILLVGCGKMGSAMLKGWLEAGYKKEHIRVVDEAASRLPVKSYDKPSAIERTFKPDVVVFAIKPQVAAEVLPLYAGYKGALFLSIMAGKTIATMKRKLGNNAAVVRAMPNLPAMVGEGISVATGKVSTAQRATALALLRSVGQAEWVAKEELMDAVTAVSGSGPAYVFHWVEAMHKAATDMGLPTNVAEALVKQTLKGSVALMADSNIKEIQQLRKDVTSKGGTTEAALEVLMNTKSGLLQLLSRAIRAAKKRSKSLSS
ncbi:MAG: pyrroline-5-carboxylate reductase [Proteobacteria bacterium]|nr:pyrroline-5-carboxylate reductase [Pseudomonadota bacterium]